MASIATPEKPYTDTAIRLDAIARLVDKTAAGARVVDSLTTPVQDDDELPLIEVFTPSSSEEPVGRGNTWPRMAVRTTLKVAGHVEATTDAALAAACDTMARQIRRALLTDSAWLRMWKAVPSVEVETGRDAESNKRRGVAVVTFVCEWEDPYLPDSDDGIDPLEELRLSMGAENEEAPVIEADVPLTEDA